MIQTSVGQWNNDTARYIYKSSRETIDSLVRNGKIPSESADGEWARMVSGWLEKSKLKIPTNIFERSGRNTNQQKETTFDNLNIDDDSPIILYAAIAAAVVVASALGYWIYKKLNAREEKITMRMHNELEELAKINGLKMPTQK